MKRQQKTPNLGEHERKWIYAFLKDHTLNRTRRRAIHRRTATSTGRTLGLIVTSGGNKGCYGTEINPEPLSLSEVQIPQENAL